MFAIQTYLLGRATEHDQPSMVFKYISCFTKCRTPIANNFNFAHKNQLYSHQTLLLSLNYKHMFGQYRVLYLESETHITTNTVMKQCKDSTDDLTPKHKETLNRTTMGSIKLMNCKRKTETEKRLRTVSKKELHGAYSHEISHKSDKMTTIQNDFCRAILWRSGIYAIVKMMKITIAQK